MTTETAPRLFRLADYRRMAETGILTRDDRVELLNGHIYTMSPIGSQHAACVNRVNKVFVSKFGDRATVAIQNPIELDDLSEPEPDVAILLPRADFYAEQHPKAADVLLLIEVSDATLRFDRTVKLPLYAKNGIPEVWLIDLKKRTVEVYAEPQNGTYQHSEIAKRGQTLTLRQLPAITVAVKDLLG